MIIIKKSIKKGWALVTVILVSALMLSVTAIVLTKTFTASKDIVRAKTLNKTDALVDSVTSNIISKIDNISWNPIGGNDGTGGSINLELNAIQLLDVIYKSTSTNLLSNNTSANLIASTQPIINSALKTGSELDINKNYYLNDFLNNKTNRTLNFLSGGSLTKMNQVIKNNSSTSLNTTCLTSNEGCNWGIDELTNKMYHKFNIEYGTGIDKVKAEARVSLIPVSTSVNGLSEQEMHTNASIMINPSTNLPILETLPDGTTKAKRNFALIPEHDDIYKLTTKVCIPECGTNSIANKQVEMIISRPIRSGKKVPPFAVYADGNIDLGNADTSSGTTMTVLDTHEGDIHSNSNVDIGATGSVGGKVTSAQTASIGTTPIPNTGIPTTGHSLSTTSQVYNKAESKSNVNPIPKPDWTFTPYPITECSTTVGWSASPKVLKDCKVSGNHSLSGTEHFQGKVYITGNLDSKGNDNFVASGDKPVQIIVDGTIDLGGNSAGLSTQESIFVSNYSGPVGCETNNPPNCPTAIKIAGNPGTGTNVGAVFYTSSPRSEISVMGTADFFGSIVASGTFKSNGAAQIRRDTDLSALSNLFPPSRKSLMMSVTSWKEVPLSLN